MTRQESRPFASVARGLAVLCCLLPPGAGAQQVVVQNDSVTDFGQAVVQTGFVAGESAAAWLTSPCAGQIVTVQVAWLSATGTASDVLGDSITIFEAGTFPVPGSELASIIGPVMVDGYFNEFTLTTPVPVVLDEVFVVAFKFDQSPIPGYGPSVVTDTDGCQAGKNGIFAIPPSIWYNACTLGVTGDFAIRAVVDCVDPLIFADGFESGNTTAWSGTVG